MPRSVPVPISPPIHPRRRHLARATVGGFVVGAVTLLTAASASAHVHVEPSSTEPGAFSVLTFRVPTESATAGTRKVEVTLPTDDPFPSVSPKALAGWTVTVTEAKLPKPVVDDDGATLTEAPHTVTWTAGPGSEVGPGQFQEFELQVGPLPASGTVVVPVVQTYSDGSVATWDEPTTAGGAEPEHPAPSFDVVAAAAATASSEPATTSDGTARLLGVVGIVVGAVGIGVGLAGAVAARRRAAA
jgi:uncharacterized protein YcnI